MSDTQSLAPAKKGTSDVKALIASEKFRDQIAKALPQHITPERFSRVIITALTKTPLLLQCSQASLLQCCMTLSQFGLEPDGRRAHLIPYKNGKTQSYDCQLIIDWKGLAELAYRSGIVSTLHADVIREGDIFNYSMGELSEHVPHFLRTDSAKPAKAGNVFAVYARAKMRDGGTKTEVMSLEDVKAIKNRSKSGNSGPWVTDFNEMAKKTVFRRLSKWLPLSAEFRDAVESDDDKLDEPRQVQGREVKSALFDEIEAPAETEQPPTKTDEFWGRCDSEGLDDTEVMAFLKAQKATTGEYPADLTEGEAETALSLFEQILTALRK